jgi:hypothetical protein
VDTSGSVAKPGSCACQYKRLRQITPETNRDFESLIPVELGEITIHFPVSDELGFRSNRQLGKADRDPTLVSVLSRLAEAPQRSGCYQMIRKRQEAR